MTGSREPREGRIIAEVVRGVLQDRGAGGVVLAAPPGPESSLLGGWLVDAGIRVLRPSPRRVEALAGALHGVPPGEDGEGNALLEAEECWRAVGRILARNEGFMVAGAVNRTGLLLLGADLPPEPLLPLGDVPASRILELAGACSLPGPFAPLAGDPGVVAALDRYLAHREGRLPGDAPALAPELEGEVLGQLAAGRWALGAPVVIPRLGSRTPGPDLAGR